MTFAQLDALIDVELGVARSEVEPEPQPATYADALALSQMRLVGGS